MANIISYGKVIKTFIGNRILMNNIHELDPDFIGFVPNPDDPDGDSKEVFQYYLTDCSDDRAWWLMDNFEDIHMEYSERLECWVLLVTHFGTDWNYVDIGASDEGMAYFRY